PLAGRAGRALSEAHLGRIPRPGSMCGSLELRQLESAVREVRLAVVARVDSNQRNRHWYVPSTHRALGPALLEAHVDAAPGLIVGEMPLVATTPGVLGEQDGAWSERELLAEPRLELQGATQSDHVLANRGTVPIEARARGAFFERHLGRLPG